MPVVHTASDGLYPRGDGVKAAPPLLLRIGVEIARRESVVK